MTSQKKTNSKPSGGIHAFLKQNPGMDWRATQLSGLEKIPSFNWKGLEDEQAEIFETLKACQRLLLVLPADDIHIILSLIKKGIHSALQIAALPRQQFKATYSSVFDNDAERIERCYQKALAVRSNLLLMHMNRLNG